MATLLVIAGSFFVISFVNPTTNVGHSFDELELTGVCKADGTDCPATADLCVCIQTYYGAYNQYAWSPVKCGRLGGWSAHSLAGSYTLGSRVALVLANPDGTCTPPA